MRKGLTNTLIIHILNNVMVHNYTSIYKTEKKELKEFVKFSVYITKFSLTILPLRLKISGVILTS